MTYYKNIVSNVDELVKENSVTNMNTLLVKLSHDENLTQDQRFEQQQRLREAIYNHHEKP
nr:DUF2526 family protein [uncultured Moellerella sp.]